MEPEPVTLPHPATDDAARALSARVCPAAWYDSPIDWTVWRPLLGARCVSVRTVPSARWTYVAPAVYEVRARKADGRLYWRCVEVAPLGRDVRFRSAAKARRVAEELAERMGVPVLTVRHGGVV